MRTSYETIRRAPTCGGSDEGHEAGWDDLAARVVVPALTDTPNPYRSGDPR